MASMMRPQFGSPPAHAHLTSVEFAIASAASFASRAEAAPSTWTSTSLDTPSPSFTIIRASATATCSSAAERISSDGRTPDAPFASAITVSFVLMSPSTVMRLNEFETTIFKILRKTVCGTSASVVITQSMVAMLGSIMPAPLAMPPTRNAPFGVSTEIEISFGKVSLVMIAPAAGRLPIRESEMALMPFARRSAGSGTPMRPVEQTRTCFGSSSKRAAVAAAVSFAAANPSAPVQALALPLLRTTARIFPVLRCSIETRTGAAFTTLVVNVAAEETGRSE